MTVRIIRNIARLVMGIVFIFSGFVKDIDPLGTTYKFWDYFEAFGLGFLSHVALVLAIFLSSAELIIGVCLFLKIRLKETVWALFLFMSFFTILTFIIALTNPVADCGCFGDAILLTNWQTFFKNLIFFVPTIIVFQQRNKFEHIFKPVTQWFVVVLIATSSVLLSVYYYYNLPLIDFRPYSIGTNIPSSMKIPEGMPIDEYKTVLDEQPWNDSTWKWIETRNVLINSGYKPPIHDFTVTSQNGVDITDTILYDNGYSLLVVAYDLEKSSLKGFEKINEFSEKAIEHDYKVYGMTASTSEILEEVIHSIDPVFEFYITDDITLKTMIRSNPGLILLKEGSIIGKWHYRNIPSEEIFEDNGMAFILSALTKERKDCIALIVVLFIGSISFLLYIFRLRKLNS
ncbi:hypothetical protein ES705_40380 [subsurface metagenome]